MRVLILGSGAREHAIAWKYSKSRRITGLYIAPGNAGTKNIGINLKEVDPDNAKQVIATCKKLKISHVFVGSETPLASGIIDELKAEGIKAIGPHKEAAQLECSKIFSKEFMKKYRIPTANAKEFCELKDFEEYLNTNKDEYLVIKKNGLSRGKGVLVSDNRKTLLTFGKTILKDDSLLAEEYLEGNEFSVISLYDGNSYKLLPVCSDFKHASEGDKGPITGGMGAICPVPFLNASMLSDVERKIIKPTFEGIAQENLNYTGILYFSLIMTKDGPMLLEYKVRFGDPETQVLAPMIISDFCNIAEAMLNQNLDEYSPRISEKSALAVAVVAEGYPENYKKGISVKRLPIMPEENAIIFHSSTTEDENGNILTGAGRSFTCVGLGSNIIKATARAYELAEKIDFDGAWFRKDIGKKFFSND